VSAASIRSSVEGGVGVVAIERQDVGNALRGVDLEALARTVEQWNQDDAVRVIVLTGSGERFFCTGSDINELAGGVSDIGVHLTKWHRVTDALERSSKPVIACINGAAVGGGLELALACHSRFAAEQVKVGLPELKVGLFPSAGGVRRMTRLVGQGKALDLILGAGMLTAPEARGLGLFERVVPAGALMAEVLAYARRIAAFEPNAVAAVLACGRAASDRTDDNELEVRLMRECYEAPRNREVLQSFLNKPPAATSESLRK
jgi:enoyl-CoA hydratase